MATAARVAAAGVGGAHQSLLDAVHQNAADALANLVNSDALADHFEDKYYVALREAAESKRGASDATRRGGLLKRTRSGGGD